MKALRILTASLAVVLLCAPAWSADEFVIDPVHSSIEFSVRHMMVTNVRGRFREFSGTILYDEKDITKSSVRVTIKTVSIDTGNENRDNHLRSPDFLDAAKYPEITFVSTRIEKRGEDYVCIGTLTIRGISREVAIPFRVLGMVKDPRGSTRLGVEAGLTINRLDYGVSWSRALEGGGLVVGNEVKIELNVQAIRRAAATSGSRGA